MFGTESPAVRGVACLQQHGMTLRTCGKRGHAANIELGTVKFHRVDPVRVHVDPRGGIGPHGIVCPTVPECAGHSDELLRAPVPVSVIQEPATPEVLAGESIGRRHHVPARPTIGQVVECRELPCHFERFVEGGVDGAHQAEAVGDGGQRRQHSEGVRPADDIEVVNAAAMLAQPQPLGKEEEVEQATLGGASQVHEGVELDLAARFGVRPHRRVVDTWKMCGEVN